MILFFPQWQGAGPGERNRIDRPARVLFDALLERARRIGGAQGLPAVAEVAVATDEIAREDGIWGRRAVLRQLRAAAVLLDRFDADRVFTIGGDCGIEVAPIAYLNARHPDFALVWIDGHADLNTPETSPSGTFHGMPLRVLMGEGDRDFTALVPISLRPDQVAMVGVRELDPDERKFIQMHAIVNFPVETPALAQALVAHLRARGARRIYIHLDLDALDPVLWPHMHYPQANGFSVGALADIVRALGESFDVAGMSLTEYDSAGGAGLDTLAPLTDLFIALSRN